MSPVQLLLENGSSIKKTNFSSEQKHADSSQSQGSALFADQSRRMFAEWGGGVLSRRDHVNACYHSLNTKCGSIFQSPHSLLVTAFYPFLCMESFSRYHSLITLSNVNMYISAVCIRPCPLYARQIQRGDIVRDGWLLQYQLGCLSY